MSELLRNAMLDRSSRVSTEDGDLAFDTTKSTVLNLFASGGSIRNLSDEEITLKISQALAENFDLGIRTLLYLSDIRGGQGERRLFKLGIKYVMENYDSNTVTTVLSNIPKFGRWDYLIELSNDKKYGNLVLHIIEDTLKSESDLLIYKWLPSVKIGNARVKSELAAVIRRHLKLTEKEYRKMLKEGRAKLKLVETDMTENRWGDIEYGKLPSKAGLIYREAFRKHDGERYEDFINKVIKGEVKINAKTLYPHEILSKVRLKGDTTADAMWANLPNFVEEGTSVLPMIDVSGSMTWYPISKGSSVYPIDVAIGLGLYLSERLSGPFKNTMMKFDTDPKMFEVIGNNLYEKYYHITNYGGMGGSTNFVKAFKYILEVAVANKLSQEDLPNTIVVFSDMQFNGNYDNSMTSHEQIKKTYEELGYKLPNIVYWDVQHRNDNYPVTKDSRGTALVSGFSPVTLKFVLGGDLKTPYELMLEVIMDERYNIYSS